MPLQGIRRVSHLHQDGVLGALPLGAPRQQQGFGVLLFIAEAFPNGTSEELAAFMDRG